MVWGRGGGGGAVAVEEAVPAADGGGAGRVSLRSPVRAAGEPPIDTPGVTSGDSLTSLRAPEYGAH